MSPAATLLFRGVAEADTIPVGNGKPDVHVQPGAQGDELGERHAAVGGQEAGVEGGGGVAAGEAPRLGHGLEELLLRVAVDGQLVDRLVRRHLLVVGLGRQHGQDGLRVGGGQLLALEMGERRMTRLAFPFVLVWRYGKERYGSQS